MSKARIVILILGAVLLSAQLMAQDNPATPGAPVIVPGFNLTPAPAPAAPVAAPSVPPAPAEPVVWPNNGPQLRVQTSMGDMLFQLDMEHAPLTVANIVRYAREGHYNNTVVYRVAPGFVIEMGSVGTDGNGRVLHDPVPLEANNGLKNVRGAISLARDVAPVSGQAEFFIVLANNAGLDPRPEDTNNTSGYAVFGHVVEGMDVVDRIAAVPVGVAAGKGHPFAEQEPQTPIVIQKVSVVGDPDPPPKPPAKAAPKAPAKGAAKKG